MRVRQKNSTAEAAFGYRFDVRVYQCQIACITLAALLAPGAHVQAEDGAPLPVNEQTPAGEITGQGLGAAVIPIGGTSLCPAPEATWQELLELVPHEHLVSRLGGQSGAAMPIQIEDLGGKFRISVLQRMREYREDARDCAHRARMASIFAALIIDPASLLEVPLCEHPPCGARAAAPEVVASVAEPPVPAPVPLPVLRLDISPLLVAGVGVDGPALHWGGAVRAAVGRGSITPVLGMAVLAPAETTIGSVRLRQWRLPLDVGIRAIVPGLHVDVFGELGITVALLSERALDLATSNSQSAVDVAGRAGLGARLKRASGVTPFVSLQAEITPRPPSVRVLPQGVVGRTPLVWIGASGGVSWGI